MPSESFSIPDITVDFIVKEVKAMSNAKETGLDDISNKLLKISIDVIGEILTHMLNISITTGYVASNWKKARVTPLFKTGDNFIVNNFRPVSVLPIVSKIIERHVFNSFYEYLDKNNLLTEHQSDLDQNIHAKRHCIALLINGCVILMKGN